MSKLIAGLKRFVREEEGAGILEYVLLVIFIALAAALAISLFGASLSSIFTETTTAVDGFGPPPGLPTNGAN